MEIKIFTTGGTIDKVYFDKKSEFQVGEPQIGELFQEGMLRSNTRWSRSYTKTVWT